MEAEHPLFLLYSSGSTAKPKGILHTTGGYLTGVTTTTAMVFDLDPDHDIFWCTADVGWITGHSYIVYGPLANGCTSVIMRRLLRDIAEGREPGDVTTLRDAAVLTQLRRGSAP